jgi:hypothetical protein
MRPTDRQTAGHLTIVLLAQLTAILLRHPDRVAAFLRKTGVVAPGSARHAGWLAGQLRVLGTASPDRTTAPGPQSAAATGAVRRFRSGAVTAASGATLLRPSADSSPTQ